MRTNLLSLTRFWVPLVPLMVLYSDIMIGSLAIRTYTNDIISRSTRYSPGNLWPAKIPFRAQVTSSKRTEYYTVKLKNNFTTYISKIPTRTRTRLINGRYDITLLDWSIIIIELWYYDKRHFFNNIFFLTISLSRFSYLPYRYNNII